jgi:hypothetical protein
MPYALSALSGGVIFARLADGTLMRSDDRGESWDELRAVRLLALAAIQQ